MGPVGGRTLSPAVLALGMILDSIFGEPRWIWSRISHPAVLMGRLIGWADQLFNKGPVRKAKGIILVVFLLAISLLLGKIVDVFPFSALLEVLLVAILVAQRSLVQHVSNVALALTGSIGEGRRAVAMIVGRDTKHMNEADVARSAIESAAENLSDGVVAPVLAFLAFGLPGLIFYKLVNTADSMIGYRTERHQEFGWAAARTDDVFNFVPARLTALILATLGGVLGAWHEISKEARQHRSPNAGWPEAAMARLLDVSLSGPRSYDNRRVDFPYVNETGRKSIGAPEIRQSVRWLWRCWASLLAVVLVYAALSW